MKSFKSKCACGIGAGISLCTIFMSLGIISAAIVGLSVNSENLREEDGGGRESVNAMNMMNMESMTMTNDPALSQNFIVAFFSGFWGEVLLFLSFGLMLVGIWFMVNKKVFVISVVGVIVLYISMYVYYSINLEIIGIVILAIAYVTAFSHKAAMVLKLA